VLNQTPITLLQEDALDTLAEIVGPTPSVGGMIPKLLVAIPDAPSWEGDIAPPGTRRRGSTQYTDVVLKIEQPGYEGLSELEAICLQIHADAGFEVPRFWRLGRDSLRLLAVERFDRTAAGRPLHLESFLSVLSAGAHNVRRSSDATWERVGSMLERLAGIAPLDAKRARKEVYRRLCMALFTGNGDLHLENLSFLTTDEGIVVAPVYDPAPMRAWPRHDLRSPLDFDLVQSFSASILRLGAAFGLSQNDSHRTVERALDATHHYVEVLADLDTVPEATKQRLVRIVQNERRDMEDALVERG